MEVTDHRQHRPWVALAMGQWYLNCVTLHAPVFLTGLNNTFPVFVGLSFVVTSGPPLPDTIPACLSGIATSFSSYRILCNTFYSRESLIGRERIN